MQSCNFTQVMYFEEWIITFSSIQIVHNVLLIAIMTVRTCILYWYLTVLPLPVRPFYLGQNRNSLWCCQLRRFISARSCFL